VPDQLQRPKLCQSPVVPTQLVGLTPEEVAFAEEVLGAEVLSLAQKPHEEMPLLSNLSCSPMIQ